MQSEAPTKMLRSSFPLQLSDAAAAAVAFAFDAVQARRAMVFLENLIDEGVASNEEKLVAAADAVVDAVQYGHSGRRLKYDVLWLSRLPWHWTLRID